MKFGDHIGFSHLVAAESGILMKLILHSISFVVTHAVGCLRILSVLAMNREWAEDLIERGVLGNR